MAGRQNLLKEHRRLKKEAEETARIQAEKDKEMVEYVRKKKEEDLAKMRREIAEAKAKKEEEDRIEKEKEDARKLESAKNVMEQMLVKARAGALLVCLVNW